MKSYHETYTGENATPYDGIPLVTGCPETDLAIHLSKNQDLKNRLSIYVKDELYSSAKLDK